MCRGAFFGDISAQDLIETNVIFGPVYYFFYLITMTLIVINLFIGIIAMAYETNTAHQYETQDGEVRVIRSWQILLSCMRNTFKHVIFLGWLDNVYFASSADPGYRFETGFSQRHSPDPEYVYLSANTTHLSKIHEKHGYVNSAQEFVWSLSLGSHRVRSPFFQSIQLKSIVLSPGEWTCLGIC